MVRKLLSRPADAGGKSPQYSSMQKPLLTALGVGGGLMVITVLGMVAVANTVVGGWMQTAFTIPIVGVVLFGGALTIGRYIGMKGATTDDIVLSILGSAVCVGVYAIFGGGILTGVSPALYAPVLVVTGGLTTAIALGAGMYVYLSSDDLSQWSRYAMYCFVGGLLAAAFGSVFEPMLLVAFALFLTGFLCNLVYDIWVTSSQNRSPVANGLALYVAFAGVFVHVLQLVVRMFLRR